MSKIGSLKSEQVTGRDLDTNGVEFISATELQMTDPG